MRIQTIYTKLEKVFDSWNLCQSDYAFYGPNNPEMDVKFVLHDDGISYQMSGQWADGMWDVLSDEYYKIDDLVDFVAV